MYYLIVYVLFLSSANNKLKTHIYKAALPQGTRNLNLLSTKHFKGNMENIVLKC